MVLLSKEWPRNSIFISKMTETNVTVLEYNGVRKDVPLSQISVCPFETAKFFQISSIGLEIYSQNNIHMHIPMECEDSSCLSKNVLDHAVLITPGSLYFVTSNRSPQQKKKFPLSSFQTPPARSVDVAPPAKKKPRPVPASNVPYVSDNLREYQVKISFTDIYCLSPYYVQVQSETVRGRMSDCRDAFDYTYYDLHPTNKEVHPRKAGKCNGGYQCENPECFDLLGDGEKNTTSFCIVRNSKGVPREVFCQICTQSQFIRHFPCGVTKCVRLPKDSLFAYCSTQGTHNPTCRGLRQKLDTEEVTSKLHHILTGGATKVVLKLISFLANISYRDIMVIYFIRC